MKTLKSSKNYSPFLFILKIWILASVISSFLFVLSNQYAIHKTLSFQETIFDDLFWRLFITVLYFSLVLSIPAILILWLIIRLWTTNKVIIVISAIFLVNITFYLTGSMELRNTKMHISAPLIYSIVISILILIIDNEKTK